MSENNKKAVKAGVAYTIGNLFIKGIVFMSTPIFTRLMSPEDYGVVSAYLAYEGVLVILVSLMIHSTIKNAFVEFSESIQEYVSSIIGLITTLTIPLTMIVFLWGSQIEVITDLSVFEQYLLVLNTFGIAVLYAYNSMISMQFKYKRFMVLAFLNSMLNIIISLILMVSILEDNKATARIIGYSTPIVLISIYIIIRTFSFNKFESFKKHMIFGLKLSLPLIPMGFADVILAQSDRIMIQFYVGNKEVGLYSLAYAIYAIIAIVRNSLDLVWTPWLFETIKSNNLTEITKKSKIYIDILIVFTSVIILFSKEITYILGGDEYRESIYSALPLVISSFIIMLNSLSLQTIQYYKENKKLAITYSITALINIFLNFILIPRVGYIAAAYTTLLSYLVLFIFNYVVVRFFIKFKSFKFANYLNAIILITIISVLSIALTSFIFRVLLVLVILLFYYNRYKEYVKIRSIIKIIKKEGK